MTTMTLITEVAEAAVAHRVSVERRMLGLPVRGRVGARIDAELAKRGLKPGALEGPAVEVQEPARAG